MVALVITGMSESVYSNKQAFVSIELVQFIAGVLELTKILTLEDGGMLPGLVLHSILP